MGSQRHAPAALSPEMVPTILQEAGCGPQGQSGGVRKISPPTGIQSQDGPSLSAYIIPAHSYFLLHA